MNCFGDFLQEPASRQVRVGFSVSSFDLGLDNIGADGVAITASGGIVGSVVLGRDPPWVWVEVGLLVSKFELSVSKLSGIRNLFMFSPQKYDLTIFRFFTSFGNLI